MRLRIFDWNTRWFWVVVFYQRAYGEPWLQLSIYPPNTWSKWWLHLWQWEKTSEHTGAYAVMVGAGQEDGDGK